MKLNTPSTSANIADLRRPTSAGEQQVRRWMDEFAAAVRAADYQRGRTLFADDVVSFGSVARMLVGIDQLAAEQWQRVWGCTRGFRFIDDQARVNVGDTIAWIASPWHSQGRDERGNWYDRHGRCTLILRRRDDGTWACCHSHFSKEPSSQPTPPGVTPA